jgi:hypothetical protein
VAFLLLFRQHSSFSYVLKIKVSVRSEPQSKYDHGYQKP